MDLRVLERSDNALSIEIGGEDHTFMNALKGSLLELDEVTAATYDMNPEQSGGQTDPILTLKTVEGEEPLEVLAKATEIVQEKGETFADAYEAAI